MDCEVQQATEEAQEQLKQINLKQPRKIVLPVDDTEHSLNAFDYYLDKSILPGDVIVLFHVTKALSVPWPEEGEQKEKSPEEHLVDAISKGQKEHEQIKAKFEKFLDKAKDKISGDNLRFQLIFGSPGESICKFARQENADIVLMGARDMGAIRRTFLGSVSDYVVHHSDIPVIVVHGGDKQKQRSLSK